VRWKAVHGWFTERSLVRRASEAVFRAAGRRHLARLDQQAPARCQARILLGLLHQARATRFGREHDFRRIRNVADFRRLVPLTTRGELWRQYWQPTYPHLAGTTWPEPALRSAALQAAHRRALHTTLALVAHCRAHARFLSGAVLWAGDDGPPAAGLLAGRLPSLLRPYVRRAADLPPEQCARLPVSCLVGPLEDLLSLTENVKQASGKRRLTDVWPGLSVVLYTRRSPAAPVGALRAEAEGALLLETAGRGEGPVAVEDPRHGLMRLLFDHGVFFEFVPPGPAGEWYRPRFGLEEAEPGVPYELVVSSPAGLWACHVGRTVCLERRDPPLVRFLDTAAPARRRPRRTDLAPPTTPAPAPHPQSADSPAAPPESFSHSPWSILADRG
jgi:hypothetical protein